MIYALLSIVFSAAMYYFPFWSTEYVVFLTYSLLFLAMASQERTHGMEIKRLKKLINVERASAAWSRKAFEEIENPPLSGVFYPHGSPPTYPSRT